MRVSEVVLSKFPTKEKFVDVIHEIDVPVGYGFGSSAAVALSLSIALNDALECKLSKIKVAQIAHGVEIECKTGLGDVLASYHGGFEIRDKPGAPGIGHVQKIALNEISIIMICFSPISTSKFIKERLPQINGLGGKMVNKLLESKNYEHFQEMSLEFAKYVDVMTPSMQTVVNELSKNNIKCGIALFGETIFSMIPKEKENKVLEILKKYSDGIIIKSELDDVGARVLHN